MTFRARVSARFVFEAAHRMPNFAPDHPNAWLHGHTYEGEVVVEGPVDPKSGFVMDHGDLEARVQEVVGVLDHRYLNDIAGLETPTSENLCRWLWLKLKPGLPMLTEIVIKRTARGVSVSYRGE